MTSLIESQRRRLLRHGFIVLFVAVWLGGATAILPHPRAANFFTLLAVIVPTTLIAFGPVMYGMRGEP